MTEAEATRQRIIAALSKSLDSLGTTPESERDNKRKAYPSKPKTNASARTKQVTKPTR